MNSQQPQKQQSKRGARQVADNLKNETDSFKSEISYYSGSIENVMKSPETKKHAEGNKGIDQIVKIDQFDQVRHASPRNDSSPLQNILIEQMDETNLNKYVPRGRDQEKHERHHHGQMNSSQQPQNDPNYLKTSKEEVNEDLSPGSKVRRAISHHEKKHTVKSSNEVKVDQMALPKMSHESKGIQKRLTVAEKQRKIDKDVGNLSSSSSVKNRKKKMTPAEKALKESQLRESIDTLKQIITKIPQPNRKDDKQQKQEGNNINKSSSFFKQNSRASQRQKFSGAVIFDEDKDGYLHFDDENIDSEYEKEQVINSNRGLLQKSLFSKQNQKNPHNLPIPDTQRSKNKLHLDSDNGKLSQGQVQIQDEQNMNDQMSNHLFSKLQNKIEVYELDFVELKPSLQLETLRRSRDSYKKAPNKITIKNKNSQINSFRESNEIPSSRSRAQQQSKSPSIIDSVMKSLNLGKPTDTPKQPEQPATEQAQVPQEKPVTPRGTQFKAQALMEILNRQKQNKLSKNNSTAGSVPQLSSRNKNSQSNNETTPKPQNDHASKDQRFWEAGGIKFTMEYINHLNHLYKMLGQKSKIKRNTAVMVPEEEIIIQEFADKQLTEEFNKRKRCMKIIKKIPWLWNLLTWYKKRFSPEVEEWEKEYLSDESLDDLEIKAPTYSSGETDQDDNLEVIYAEMTLDEKNQRILELWRRTAAKAVGGARIVKIFKELSDTIAMFGVSRRIAVVIDDDIKPLPIILMPDNKFRMAWNIVTMLLLLYTASFVPYRTSFIEVAPNGLVVWEWIVDGLFIIDIFINFVSAFENQDKNIEVRMKVIASTYIQSWFFFDLTAVFPFQLLENSDVAQLMQAENAIIQENYSHSTIVVDMTNVTYEKNDPLDPFQMELNRQAKQSSGAGNIQRSNQNINKLIRLARLPRLYRLMRIVRLFKIFSLLKNNASFKRLQELINLNVGVQRILVITLVVIFMVHLMACIFFLVSKFEDEDQDNWAVAAGINDDIDSYQYLVSLYWALQTLTTVGYGDITPKSAIEKVTGLIWMIIGVGFYSFTIGNLASIFNSIDIKAAQLQQKLAVLSEFSKRTHLPEELQNRVKRFLENNHGDHLSVSDQKKLLEDVPASMRAEVVSHTHKEIIRRIKFLSDKDTPFLFTILPLLKPMKVYPKDTLYQQGDYAEEIFFIFQGRIKLYIDLNETGEGEMINVPFNLYVEGSYFGDSDIFPNPNQDHGEDDRNQRDCTAIAEVESSLLVITRKELVDVFKRFKDIAKEMKSIGYERKKHHMKSINALLEKNREKIIMQKLSKAIAHSRTIKKPGDGEEVKGQDDKMSFFFGLKDTDSVKESARQGQQIANKKLRMKQKMITKDPQEEILHMLQTVTGGHITLDMKKKKELMTSKSPKKKTISDPIGSSKMVDETGSQSVNLPARERNSSIQNIKKSLNSIKEEEEELKARSSLSDELTDEASHDEPKGNSRKKQKQDRSSKPHLDPKKSQLKISGNNLPIVIVEGEEEPLRNGSNSRNLNNLNIRNVGLVSTNASLDVITDAANKLMEVEDSLVYAADDIQWKINEEIMNGFQENMALIAGNSFEILQLYLMIQEDYAKVTEKIVEAEHSIKNIANKSTNLEQRLTKLMELL